MHHDMRLTASIVTYRTDLLELEKVLDLVEEGDLLLAVVLFGLVALSLGCSGGCFIVCHL